ncbi:hypothetical protein VAMP_379n50 [Candidatus Vampirococcus lugosii]|uniref:Uncharacterized protein n=1 Tax=Candidatus Vampirococcus lugosii TaxID=2789015 RepID=A0ABS5QP92_9BACT|nr:hypothetical protein [Candidatus Vampirococcus lugosii]
MKTIGFRKPYKKKSIFKRIFINISYIYIFFLFSFFYLFSAYNTISPAISSGGIDFNILEEKIEDIAIYVWSFDSDLSRFLLSLKVILDTYKLEGNIFDENTEDLFVIVSYFENNIYKINNITKNKYEDFLNLLGESLEYKKTIFYLLGKDKTQNYIIALQNSNEVRPNGGFFGSYILVQIENGRLLNYELIDSYQVNHINPDAKIQAPKRRQENISKNDIGFVSSNVLGFTDRDGQNIIDIHNQAFPDISIDGIIFLQSDLFNEIIPGFEKKIWEWQFINANTDKIESNNGDGKKAIYMQEVNNFINKNFLSLTNLALQNFNKIIQKGYIQIYIPNIKNEFNDFLIKNNLSTQFEENKIYSWDFNYSYNKIDGFVDKNIQIFSGNKLLYSQGNNIIDFGKFKEGNYKINISYDLNIPTYYENFISNLESKYEISNSEREKHILNLTYIFDNMGIFLLSQKLRYTKYFLKKIKKFGNNRNGSIQYFIVFNRLKMK